MQDSDTKNVSSVLQKMKIVNRDVLKWIAAFFMGIGHFLLFTYSELHFIGLPNVISSFFI